MGTSINSHNRKDNRTDNFHTKRLNQQIKRMDRHRKIKQNV